MNKMQIRRQAIKVFLSTVESISVEDLAERLQVTGATIRTDLRDMESRHEIYRSHGKVSLVRPHIVDLDIQEKIFINAERMARHIEAKQSLNVVTPSIGVALALSRKDNVNVVILGGKLVRKSLSVRDQYTIEGLKHVSCTKLFFSCDGLDLSSGVITAFVDEARLTRAMMNAAGKSILLADSSKVGKTGFGKICNLRDVDVLITDTGLPENVKDKFEEAGISVIVA